MTEGVVGGRLGPYRRLVSKRDIRDKNSLVGVIYSGVRQEVVKGVVHWQRMRSWANYKSVKQRLRFDSLNPVGLAIPKIEFNNFLSSALYD